MPLPVSAVAVDPVGAGDTLTVASDQAAEYDEFR
jgi:hypothetical protein